MKLSKVATEKVADMICDLMPHIHSIMTDPKISDSISGIMDAAEAAKGKSTAQVIADAVENYSTLIPILLKDHRDDTFSVLAIMNDKTVEEIAAQSFAETIKQVKEVSKDDDLILLFHSQEQTGDATSSTPALETTKE